MIPSRSRAGLLGGTFDPPHLGHLRLGDLAWQHLALDELRFVPAALPPLKDRIPSEGALRERLLRLLLQDRPWILDPCELRRGGVSYTVDTLEALATRFPDHAWILVLGFDQAVQLAAWHRPDRIWELASVAAAPRPGQGAALPGNLGARLRETWSGAPGELVLLPPTELDLSSRGIREVLAQGGRPEGLPPQVLGAILAENLYR